MADEGPSNSEGFSPSANEVNQVWKLLGRDTPGGKALFNLYGGDKNGRASGQEFHNRNAKMHAKKIASGWSPKPQEVPKPEYPRPQVNYPKFGVHRPNSEEYSAVKLNQIPRRRPAELIQKELQEEQERARSAHPPRPRGPLLDDAEKARLAGMMQYRGKLPQASTGELEEAARHRGARPGRPRNQREELQAMFDAVSQEVDERRTFLADMEKVGGLKKDHVHQIRAEIALRVDDMNRIDRMLRELE